MLTRSEAAEVLSYDPLTGVFVWRIRPNGRVPAGTQAGTLNKSGYRSISIGGKIYREHRLAWLFMHGEFPVEIDHRNAKKADNRIANLRLATRSQNGGNASLSKRNTSGAKGVHWRPDNRKWRALIMANRKMINLGHFDEKDDAIAAYAKAAKQHFGEFARTS